MSFMLDVYYPLPEDAARETRISEIANGLGGQFWTKNDLCDSGEHDRPATRMLIFDFEDFDAAKLAQKELLKSGEWAEPPYDVGD